jgi:hypothetical protein
MSIVASLEGPEYDLERMQHAVKELRSFLATNPENPELVREAKEAEQRLLEWQVERHLLIVHFYHRVGNVAGQLYHLDIAARAEFAGTSRYAEAVAARDTLRQSQGQAVTPP